MDFDARSIGGREPLTLDQLFNEIEPPTSTDPIIEIEQEDIVHKDDAVLAMKLDPAVLEAQVTVGEEATRTTYRASIYADHDPGRRNSSSAPSVTSSSSSQSQFESMMDMQQAALLSLTPHQFQLLMKFVETLRKQRRAQQISLECGFCKKNGEPAAWYTTHALKSWQGNVQCPVLRALRCPRCGAYGDNAHTIKHCPLVHKHYVRRVNVNGDRQSKNSN